MNTRVRLLNDVAQAWQQLVTLCSLGAAVVWFSPVLALLLVVSLIPWFYAETRFAMLAYQLRRSRTQGNRVLEYLRLIGTGAASVKEVKLFGLGPYLVDQYRKLADVLYEETRALGIRRVTAGGLLSLCSSGAYYVAYAKILLDTVSGHLSIGTMTFLAAAFTRTSGGMHGILRAFTAIADQAVFLNDLFDFFQLRPRTSPLASPLPAPRPIRDGIIFRDVSFTYPGARQPVVQHINMHITPASLIALVGASGAGKTTLLKLLTRLYDPSSGVILLDGVDLREYDTRGLWRQIAVIFQDHVRYDLSFRENIGFGYVEEIQNDERLREAARRGLADHLVERYPAGMDQVLGRRFKTGVDLSAGEWQRVALARAYMRGAQMLVLDEPTASLDARSEYEVFREFSRAAAGCTALLISHRLSTVRMADHIFVLDNGQVHEQGTHNELLAHGGRYADLFRLQASGYH
jgi:ATP-binding cassette subfamily B protein